MPIVSPFLFSTDFLKLAKLIQSEKFLVCVIAEILDMKLVESQKLLSNVIAGNASILQVVIQILLWYFPKIRSVTVQEM